MITLSCEPQSHELIFININPQNHGDDCLIYRQILSSMKDNLISPKILKSKEIIFSKIMNTQNEDSFEVIGTISILQRSILLSIALNIPYLLRKVLKDIGYLGILRIVNQQNNDNKQNLKLIYQKENETIFISDILYRSSIAMKNIISKTLSIIFQYSLKMYQSLNKVLKRFDLSKRQNPVSNQSIKMLRIFYQERRKQRIKSSNVNLQNSYRMRITQQQFYLNPFVCVQKISEGRQYGDLLKIFEQKLQELQNQYQQQITQNYDNITKKIKIVKKQEIFYTHNKICAGANAKVQNFLYHFQIIDLDIDPKTVQIYQQYLEHKNTLRQKKYDCIHDYHEASNTPQTNDRSSVLDKQQYVMNLIKKSPLSKEPQPFNIEKQVIYYMRQSVCKHISAYFFQYSSKNYKDIEQIYLPCYDSQFSLQMNAKKIRQILYSLSFGIFFLFSMKICHRDLKPENIMLNSSQSPKIIDFGSAAPHYSCFFHQQTKNQPYNLRTTRYYNIFYVDLPKSLSKHFTKIQFERHPLFDIFSIGKILKKFIAENYEMIHQMGAYFIQQYTYIINRCCQLNPADRLQIDQIIVFLKAMDECLIHNGY